MVLTLPTFLSQVFDETDGKWDMHLDGAKQMVQTLCSNYGQRLHPEFLFSWFLYHEVLGCFTQPRRDTYQGFQLLQAFHVPTYDTTHVCSPLLLCSVGITAKQPH